MVAAPLPSSVTTGSPGRSAPVGTQPRSAVSQGWVALV